MGLGDAFRSWWLSREVRRLLIAGERKNALAHLILIAGPDTLRFRVQRLLRRAERAGYVGSEYQKQNEDEFFACAYTEYLARRYGLDAEQHLDDRCVSADGFALFEVLDR